MLSIPSAFLSLLMHVYVPVCVYVLVHVCCMFSHMSLIYLYVATFPISPFSLSHHPDHILDIKEFSLTYTHIQYTHTPRFSQFFSSLFFPFVAHHLDVTASLYLSLSAPSFLTFSFCFFHSFSTTKLILLLSGSSNSQINNKQKSKAFPWK